MGKKNPSVALRNWRHGMRNTKEYHTWSSMMQRCTSPGNPAWHNYGGRGIKVWSRWHKFVNFYIDMGPKPDGADLDRINNNKGYFPSNCRWATRSQNIRNTRATFKITIDGVTKSGAEWAEIVGVDRHTIIGRYKKGWRGSKLLTPSRKSKLLEGVK